MVSWALLLISITILSYPDLKLGFITFFIMLFLSYFLHKESHRYKNIITIAHHYHHNNNNFLSHFIQILVEISIGSIFALLYNIFKTSFLNPWIIIFYIIFYSTVHNINYSIFHVNRVHELHHKHIHTNLGPDICDIIGRTKNALESYVENTNHYIPNIVVAFIIVTIIKYFWKNDTNKKYITCFMNYVLLFFYLIILFTSIYLWYYNM